MGDGTWNDSLRLLVGPATTTEDELCTNIVEDGRNTAVVVSTTSMLLVCVNDDALADSCIDIETTTDEDGMTWVIVGVVTTAVLSTDIVWTNERVILDSTPGDVSAVVVRSTGSELAEKLELSTNIAPVELAAAVPTGSEVRVGMDRELARLDGPAVVVGETWKVVNARVGATTVDEVGAATELVISTTKLVNLSEVMVDILLSTGVGDGDSEVDVVSTADSVCEISTKDDDSGVAGVGLISIVDVSTGATTSVVVLIWTDSDWVEDVKPVLDTRTIEVILGGVIIVVVGSGDWGVVENVLLLDISCISVEVRPGSRELLVRGRLTSSVEVAICSDSDTLGVETWRVLDGNITVLWPEDWAVVEDTSCVIVTATSLDSTGVKLLLMIGVDIIVTPSKLVMELEEDD